MARYLRLLVALAALAVAAEAGIGLKHRKEQSTTTEAANCSSTTTEKPHHAHGSSTTTEKPQHGHGSSTTEKSHHAHGSSSTTEKSHHAHGSSTTEKSHHAHGSSTTEKSHHAHGSSTTEKSHHGHGASTTEKSHHAHGSSTTEKSHHGHGSSTTKKSHHGHGSSTTPKKSHHAHGSSSTEKSHHGHGVSSTTEKVEVSTKKPSFKTLVHNCEVIGKALPAALKLHWKIRTTRQTINITDAERHEEKQSAGQARKAVQETFKVLNQVEKKIIANVTAFAKLQVKQTEAIVKNYTTLLKAHLSSKSTDEQSIHALRASATKVMNSWTALLSEVHEYAHQAFESTVRKEAVAVSKQYKHPVNDEVRVAATNAGIHVLEVLVQEQNRDTVLLTSTQFGLFQSYFQQCETVLLQMLEAAKSGQQ